MTLTQWLLLMGDSIICIAIAIWLLYSCFGNEKKKND